MVPQLHSGGRLAMASRRAQRIRKNHARALFFSRSRAFLSSGSMNAGVNESAHAKESALEHWRSRKNLSRKLG
jgi:hypothetical protein